jgi:hypothetical protein
MRPPTCSGVEDDRDGTVVDQRDLHPRTEDTARDPGAGLRERVAEAFVQRLGVVGARGGREARPASLLCIENERDLTPLRLDELPDQPMTLSYPNPPLTDGTVTLRRYETTDIGCVEEGSRDPDIPSGTTVPAKFRKRKVLPGSSASGDVTKRARDSRWRSRRHTPMRRSGTSTCCSGGNLARSRSATGLVERARGRGFGSRAVALLALWAVTTAGLARVEALVVPDNIASQRVLEKAGFQREGHLRSYLVFETRRADAFVYSLLPSDLA